MCADARPELMGQDQTVPLVTGEWRRYVNLDYAASTPPLLEVVRDPAFQGEVEALGGYDVSDMGRVVWES